MISSERDFVEIFNSHKDNNSLRTSISKILKLIKLYSTHEDYP